MLPGSVLRFSWCLSCSLFVHPVLTFISYFACWRYCVNYIHVNISIPGEQVHILACLSACKQDIEIITPFKVAAVMSKNGMGQKPEKQNGNVKEGTNLVSREGEVSTDAQVTDQNGNEPSKREIDLKKDISTSESILRMENHKRQTEMLLQRFRNSHFFVRIAESGELLWSKKGAPEMDDLKSEPLSM